MKKPKKYILVLGCIVLLFIITNPGAKRFKEYSGASNYDDFTRKQNWIIFSIYEKSGDKYVGVFLNFFEMRGS